MTKFRRRIELNRPVVQRVRGLWPEAATVAEIEPPARIKPEAATVADVEALARTKTEAALTVLALIMYRENASATARVAAAKEILDRGWGRPVQPLVADKPPADVLHRIERVIVHPEHSRITLINDSQTVGLDAPVDADVRKDVLT